MNALEALRDSIDEMTRNPEDARPEQVEQLSQSYNDACEEPALRLHRCLEYLAKGMRSESLHLAESPPNLFDTVRSLQVADAASWSALCRKFGYRAETAFKAGDLALLEKERTTELELSDYLDRHRLLSLAQSPVRERIAVLWQLSTRDPTNEIWKEQLRPLERQRGAELQSLFDKLDKLSESELETLLLEVTSKSWSRPINPVWVKRVKVRYLRVRGAKMVALLPINELRAAVASRSLETCARVLQKWQGVVVDNPGLIVPPELLAEVRQTTALLIRETRRREIEKASRSSPTGAESSKPQSPPTGDEARRFPRKFFKRDGDR